MTSTDCHPFETSRKRRRGLCLGNAGAARRPRRARRQGADREARPQRPVPVRLGTALSRSAACAPAASTAASGTIMFAIDSRGGPRPVASLGSGAIGGAVDSDSAGCRFDPCLPNHPASRFAGCARSQGFGELAERQGIAVLTRRNRKVGQVRLLHSPPNSCVTSPTAEAMRSDRIQSEFKSPVTHHPASRCALRRMPSEALAEEGICPRSPIGRGPGLNPGKCGFDARRGYARVAQRQRQRLQTPLSGRSNRPSRTIWIAPFAKWSKASVLHTDSTEVRILDGAPNNATHVSRRSDGGGR
jgi:hypothetical protein